MPGTLRPGARGVGRGRGRHAVDRYDLYERCVQAPAIMARFLRAVHGGAPRTLREDFCGTGAVSRAWVQNSPPGPQTSRAVCVDIDAGVLAAAQERALQANVASHVAFIKADAIGPAVGAEAGSADIVLVGNFSIGYIGTRRMLLNYMQMSRQRLRPGGIFVCDTYGGASAFKPGGFERRVVLEDGSLVSFAWERVACDPLRGTVENAASFRILRAGQVEHEFPRAFTYRWRLWSIAELREALEEAGFVSTEVHTRVDAESGGGIVPVRNPHELGEDWAVAVVGRAG